MEKKTLKELIEEDYQKAKKVHKNFLKECENIFENYKSKEIDKLNNENKDAAKESRKKYIEQVDRTLRNYNMRSDVLQMIGFDMEFYQNSINNIIKKDKEESDFNDLFERINSKS